MGPEKLSLLGEPPPNPIHKKIPTNLIKLMPLFLMGYKSK
jgi:hypothetical protein